jgi:hypothetical protein
MWPLLLYLLHLSHHSTLVDLVLVLAIWYLRPKSLILMISVLVALLARNQDRADRAVELVRALCGRERRWTRDRKALPPGSAP